jgi:copper transport protein
MTSICFRSGRIRIALLLGWVLLLLVACGGGSSSQGQSATPTATSSFQTTVETTDKMFRVQFNVTPNQLGTNTFTVVVKNANGSDPTSPLQVRLSTTMLDMDMGTDTFDLQPNGKGQYSAQDDLGMNGNWQVDIDLQTSDHTLHKATVPLHVLT